MLPRAPRFARSVREKWDVGEKPPPSFPPRQDSFNFFHSPRIVTLNCHPEARVLCGPKDLCNFRPLRMWM